MAKRSPHPIVPPETRYDWHRLFGLLLTGHLEGSPFVVELEKDLSIKQQLLDVVIVRRGPGVVLRMLPDGLDDLVEHNLITFKSYREALDDWALKELTGHYVNYRKQVSPRGAHLPETQFRLVAVCARSPRDLFQALPPAMVQAGVYLLCRGTDRITIIVASELPLTERNAMLHLFSAAEDRIQYGVEHYPLPTPDTSTIVNNLFKQYRIEGLTMPYTMDDFRKEVAREVIDQLTPEERLRGLPTEERLRGLPTEERLRGLPTEERLRGLPPEELAKRLTLEQRMAGLPPEQIESYLKSLREESRSTQKKKPKPKK